MEEYYTVSTHDIIFFQILSLEFILKIFFKSRKFQPRYSYKSILICKKEFIRPKVFMLLAYLQITSCADVFMACHAILSHTLWLWIGGKIACRVIRTSALEKRLGTRIMHRSWNSLTRYSRTLHKCTKEHIAWSLLLFSNFFFLSWHAKIKFYQLWW